MKSNDFARLRPWLLATDVGMLVYWTLSALLLAGLIHIPQDWLFSDSNDPTVCAWNWSFLPLDVIFSAAGLVAAYLHRAGDPRWQPLCFVSLVLTFCSGLMAISFWAIRADFQITWWAFNLFLVIWPLWFLPRFFPRPTPDAGSTGCL